MCCDLWRPHVLLLFWIIKCSVEDYGKLNQGMKNRTSDQPQTTCLERSVITFLATRRAILEVEIKSSSKSNNVVARRIKRKKTKEDYGNLEIFQFLNNREFIP